MPFPRDITIIGTGRVAQALGRALVNSGVAVLCVAGRSQERAAQAAKFIGGGCGAVTFGEAARRAECALIAVTDRAIEPVAGELVSAGGRIRVALHTCGNGGAELLRPLAERGASCGRMHPLQTICSPQQGAEAFGGIGFGISGDAEAVRLAEAIAVRLGGRPFRIAAGANPERPRR